MKSLIIFIVGLCLSVRVSTALENEGEQAEATSETKSYGAIKGVVLDKEP